MGCCKAIAIVAKTILVLFSTVCQSIVLHHSRLDLENYKNGFSPRYAGLSPSDVDVDQFEIAFKVYASFYAVGLFISILIFIYQVKSICDGELPILFFFIGVAILIELPMLLAETHMLKFRGSVDWEHQKTDMLLHIVYVLNLPLHLMIALWVYLEKSYEGFCFGFIATPICFLVGCMLYAFPSFVLLGFKRFESFELEDFGGTVSTEGAKQLLLLLALIGQIGQVLWVIVLSIFGLILIYKCWKICGCDESEDGGDCLWTVVEVFLRFMTGGA